MDPTPFFTGTLVQGAESQPFAFVVLLGPGVQTFIRVLAHFADDDLLGGTPPTVSITAGKGPVAAVTAPRGPAAEPEAVPIIGSDEMTVVASATCVRTPEDPDTYLVVITHREDSGPWHFTIRNEESNPLRFFGFHSNDEAATLRPWMQLEAADENGVRLGGVGPTTARIRVRNVGPVPLELHGRAGDTFGEAPATITQLPNAPVRAHRTATIVVGCAPLAEVAVAQVRALSHTFSSNDPDDAHGRIGFEISSPLLPPFRCRSELHDGSPCPCREFDALPPPDADGCRSCNHDKGFHGMEPSPPNPFPQ